MAQKKIDGVAMLPVGPLAAIGRLREMHILRFHARHHRNIAPAHGGKIAIDKPCAQFGIAKGGLHAEQPQFGTAQHKRQRKRVIDVVPDIGIEDHQLARGSRCGNPGRRLSQKA